MGAAATKLARSQGSQPRKRAAAKEGPPLPDPDTAEKQAKQPAGPYPKDVMVYAYQPKDGGEPILLAMNGFESPDKLWLFDIAQLPVLAQTWAWMKRANIPTEIQRQAQRLPDAEYFAMFDEWFAAVKVLNRSGPKGAVTSAK